MMSIAEQLDELAAAVPEMCVKHGDRFLIGDYSFWLDGGELWVSVRGRFAQATGQPALDWLAGAAIEALNNLGFFMAMCYQSPPPYHPHWHVAFCRPEQEPNRGEASTLAEAVLSALLAAKRAVNNG